MKVNNPWLVGLVIVVGLQAIAIGNILYRQNLASDKKATAIAAPAKLEPIPGSKMMRVILTAKAAERLGIKTVKLTEGTATTDSARGATLEKVSTAATRRSTPYASLLYDLDGSTWVYVETAPLTFERRSVEVASIVGDEVFMTNGPPAGTSVVSQGAIEIFGAETKVGH